MKPSRTIALALSLAFAGSAYAAKECYSPTLTNNGAYGTVITAPIVNSPQVAILSTDSVRKKPVVIEAPEGDSIAVRPVGTLAQSFDHRAVDGAYAAAFLRELKGIIETRHWIQDLQS